MRVRTLFYILCGIYIAANLISAFILFDALSVPGSTALKIIAVCGNGISVTGIILLFFKKRIGLVTAFVGSAICVAFTIVSGIFIVGIAPHFDASGFIGFMLLELLPGMALWLQMKPAAYINLKSFGRKQVCGRNGFPCRPTLCIDRRE